PGPRPACRGSGCRRRRHPAVQVDPVHPGHPASRGRHPVRDYSGSCFSQEPPVKKVHTGFYLTAEERSPQPVCDRIHHRDEKRLNPMSKKGTDRTPLAAVCYTGHSGGRLSSLALERTVMASPSRAGFILAIVLIAACNNDTLVNPP